MVNTEIRTAAKKSGVFLWEVADAMGISMPTMTRRLRYEFSDKDKKTY